MLMELLKKECNTDIIYCPYVPLWKNKKLPKISAEDIVGVQLMISPTGECFSFKFEKEYEQIEFILEEEMKI